MAAYTLMPVLEVLLNGLRLPFSTIWLRGSSRPRSASGRFSGFLLLYLLQLDVYPKLARLVKIGAFIGVLVGFLDGALSLAIHFDMNSVLVQIADAVLTAFILPLELVPILLVLYAILRRQRLDSARWVVAIFALLSGTWYSIGNIVDEGAASPTGLLDQA